MAAILSKGKWVNNSHGTGVAFQGVLFNDSSHSKYDFRKYFEMTLLHWNDSWYSETGFIWKYCEVTSGVQWNIFTWLQVVHGYCFQNYSYSEGSFRIQLTDKPTGWILTQEHLSTHRAHYHNNGYIKFTENLPTLTYKIETPSVMEPHQFGEVPLVVM